jgi:hypothetical protein
MVMRLDGEAKAVSPAADLLARDLAFLIHPLHDSKAQRSGHRRL